MTKQELINQVAQKYKDKLDMDSLLEAGNHGWDLAQKNFKSDKLNFNAYALWWVRAAIIEKITNVPIAKIAQIEELIG